MTPARFPHSDTPGSTLGCQLPRAYRRLLRPSSALDAKASTTCPSQLVTHTTNPHHPTTPGQTTKAQPRTTGRHRQTVHTQHATKEPHTPPPINEGMHKQAATHTQHNTGHRQLQDARVHYPDLKQQPHTTPTRSTSHEQEQPGHTKPHTPHHHTNQPATTSYQQSSYRQTSRPATGTPVPTTTSYQLPATSYRQTGRPAVWFTGASDSSEPQQCVADVPHLPRHHHAGARTAPVRVCAP
jgi:hypothetical protein